MHAETEYERIRREFLEAIEDVAIATISNEEFTTIMREGIERMATYMPPHDRLKRIINDIPERLRIPPAEQELVRRHSHGGAHAKPL